MSHLSTKERDEVKRIVSSAITRVIGKPERKYYDTADVLSVAVTNSGVSGSFATIAQGVTTEDRLGNEIYLRSLSIRLLALNSFNNTAPCVFRFIVGLDLKSTGTPPTAAEVLAHTGSGPVPSVFSPRNVTLTRSRFKILSDKTYVLSGATVVASIPAGSMQMNSMVGSAKFIRKAFKLHTKMQFDGTSGADYQYNSPFYLAISDRANPNEPTLDIQARVGFNDVS